MDLLANESEKVAWAVRVLSSLLTVLQGRLARDERLEKVRAYFRSPSLRIGHSISDNEIRQWVDGLSLAASNNDFQAELHSALARRNSLGNNEKMLA